MSDINSLIGYYITAAAVILILNFSSCKDEPVAPPVDQPKKDTITVAVEDISNRSVTINIKTTNYNAPQYVNLYRIVGPYQNVIARYPATVSDTSVYDDNAGLGLTINSLYKYYAALTDSAGKIKDTSSTIETRTLDKTSHNYSWQQFVIGDFQSHLFGVWGADDDDVWAVGIVMQNSKYVSAFHWDGINWKSDSTVYGNNIFGFSKDNIWACAAFIYHYNGNVWEQIQGMNTPGIKITLWGSSSSDMYFGTEINSTIYHWDGSNRTEVLQSNELYYMDIWGFGTADVYTVAANNTSNIPDKIYHYDGTSWKVIKETGIIYPLEVNLYKPLESVWGKNSKEVFFAGRRIYKLVNRTWYRETIQLEGIVKRIRGSNSNNIVAMCENGTLYHYNGSTWQKIFSQPGILVYGLFVTDNKIFCVGDDGFSARIIIGTKTN